MLQISQYSLSEYRVLQRYLATALFHQLVYLHLLLAIQRSSKIFNFLIKENLIKSLVNHPYNIVCFRHSCHRDRGCLFMSYFFGPILMFSFSFLIINLFLLNWNHMMVMLSIVMFMIMLMIIIDIYNTFAPQISFHFRFGDKKPPDSFDLFTIL